MSCLAQVLAVAALGKSGRAIVADKRAVPILALSLGTRCLEARPREGVDCWPDGAVRLRHHKDETRFAPWAGDPVLMDPAALSAFPGQTPVLMLEDPQASLMPGYTLPVSRARALRCVRNAPGLSKMLSQTAENIFQRQTGPFDLLEAAFGSQKQAGRLSYSADGGGWLALSPLWCRSFPDRLSLMANMFGDAVPLRRGAVAQFRLPVMQGTGQRVSLQFENEKPHAVPEIRCKDPDARLEIGEMDESGVIEIVLHASGAAYLDVSIGGHRQSLQSIQVHLSFEQADAGDPGRDPLDDYGDPLDAYREEEP